MTPRERVLDALSHREPDRVPFDLGGTILSSIHVRAYERLRQHLGLPARPPVLFDRYQQIVELDPDVKERFEVDAVGIAPRPAEPPEVLEDAESYYTYDDYGVGWRMPKDGGWYFDMFHHPLAGRISAADVDAFPWPDPAEPSQYVHLRGDAERAAAEGRAVVACNFGSVGVLEAFACLRGFESYFLDLARDHALAEKIMDRVLELKLAYWERTFEIAGDLIDIAQEADDFAGQERMLLSPEVYRKLVKPRHAVLFDFIHSKSRARVFFHSDGAIRPVIPDLIEIGVDVLNPIQVSAAGMDPAELKREFGRDLAFWGGGVDTQNVLGTASPPEVREEVKRRLDALMPGGGFVFATVHNVQAEVPPENIVAMWEAVREHGSYR